MMKDELTQGERTEIILIGPVGAGKSTIGRLLAQKLGLPQVSMDDIRYDYYKEIGYDEAYAKRLRAEQGFPALVAYWKPFEAHAVERLLADYHDCVFDISWSTRRIDCWQSMLSTGEVSQKNRPATLSWKKYHDAPEQRTIYSNHQRILYLRRGTHPQPVPRRGRGAECGRAGGADRAGPDAGDDLAHH